MILGAANAFTGAVAVNGGALDVDGSVGAGADLSVNSGGVLTGDGTIGRAVVLNANGAVMPGGPAAASALTVDSLAWNPGGVLAFNLDATSNRLAVAGALTKGRSRAASLHFRYRRRFRSRQCLHASHIRFDRSDRLRPDIQRPASWLHRRVHRDLEQHRL